jgi:hypothetical protein
MLENVLLTLSNCVDDNKLASNDVVMNHGVSILVELMERYLPLIGGGDSSDEPSADSGISSIADSQQACSIIDCASLVVANCADASAAGCADIYRSGGGVSLFLSLLCSQSESIQANAALVLTRLCALGLARAPPSRPSSARSESSVGASSSGALTGRALAVACPESEEVWAPPPATNRGGKGGWRESGGRTGGGLLCGSKEVGSSP